jgi:dTDP-4-amino-4,6-dideoxygalactose transaminase
VIRLNDLRREYAIFEHPLQEAARAVVASGHYLSGAATKTFCEQFGAYLGMPHVIPVANGTDALELALRAGDVGEGSEVILAANAGGYGSIAARLIGATPVYADVCMPSLTLDPASVEEMLSPHTRAIIVTHLYGNHADMASIQALLAGRGRADVALIEDCAQAHGARMGNRLAGTWGSLASFSFYPTKNLGALGDAGAVVTADAALAARLHLLHQYGWESRYRTVMPGGRNSRMDEIQAAFLSIKLARLDELNARRRSVLERYRRSIPAAYRLCAREGEETVAHLAVILCPDRAAAAAHLERHGVETGIHYPILDCDQPGWRDMQSRAAALTETRRAVAGILTVPCYSHLTDVECATVCDALASLP